MSLPRRGAPAWAGFGFEHVGCGQMARAALHVRGGRHSGPAGQDVESLGGQPAPAIAPLFVEEYDDEVSVMYFDLQHAPVAGAARLEPVERLLGLRGGENGGVPGTGGWTGLRIGQGVCLRRTQEAACPEYRFWLFLFASLPGWQL